MNSDRHLTIERGHDGFVALYGERSCTPEVSEIMQTIEGLQQPTTADVEARLPIWVAPGGPRNRWHIHMSPLASWESMEPAIREAYDLLDAHGYFVSTLPDIVKLPTDMMLTLEQIDTINRELDDFHRRSGSEGV